MGAVSTTTMAGVLLARAGKALPVGSLTQMGTIRLGRRTDKRVPKISDFVPLAGLSQLEFGGWDIFPDNAFEAAEHARVLERHHLDAVREELALVRPMKGVFYPGYVKRLHGTHTKSAASKAEMVEQVRDDIRTFKRDRGCDRLVAVWCGSTEAFITAGPVHASVEAFEEGLRKDDVGISERADLRVGLPQGARAVRERRAQPLRRLPRRMGSGPRIHTSPLPAKTSRPGRR